MITGVAPGTGRVQAFVGSLASGLVSFTVIPRADTLIVTDSLLTVAPGAATSPPLVASGAKPFSWSAALPIGDLYHTSARPR